MTLSSGPADALLSGLSIWLKHSMKLDKPTASVYNAAIILPRQTCNAMRSLRTAQGHGASQRPCCFEQA